jgi:maltodextrin utilization protein YvdJ
MPYSWALLHIIPLLVLIETLWYGEHDPFIISATAATLVAGFAIVAGLLIKGRWARFLIIMGISIWFLLATFIAGIGV